MTRIPSYLAAQQNHDLALPAESPQHQLLEGITNNDLIDKVKRACDDKTQRLCDWEMLPNTGVGDRIEIDSMLRIVVVTESDDAHRVLRDVFEAHIAYCNKALELLEGK